jgi:hypothetical protein
VTAFDGGAFHSGAFDAAAAVVIPGVGPAGAATFLQDLEVGSSLTFSWRTEVQQAENGLEQRICNGDAPAIAYDFTAFMFDDEERTVRSALIVAAATSQPFLVTLPFEGLELAADAAGAVVPVGSTALCDWANPGQRVIVMAPDDTASPGVVQSAAGTTITLDVAPGTAGKKGGRIMPAVAVYLDPEQGFRRHPIAVSHWQLKAISALFGYAGVDTMGVGAAVTTFDGLPVYDRGIRVDGQSEQALLTLGTIIDAGGLRVAAGAATVSALRRPIEIKSNDVAQWQWFKAFLFTVKGMFAPFLRPTWQPDLVFDSNPGSATLKIKSASVAGAGNYLTYFNNSLAHRRLQIRKTDGTIQYVIVSAAGDNGDGTITLNLNATVTGTPALISFLETCRLDSDDVKVSWLQWQFMSKLSARVVQQ